MLPFLRKVLNDHAELEGQICRMNGIETGVVRIGTFASVAIHWLPNIFSALQRDYPGIGYEMLLGDYDEVERWIGEGRVDCGFLRLPTLPGFDTMLLKQDEYKVVLPVGHPLAVHESVPIEALNGLPFCCWSTAERPRSPTCWSARTCSQTSGLRRGLGVGILPDLILRRIPYRIEIRPLANPYYRPISLAVNPPSHLTPAVRKFIEYLPFREAAE